MSLIEQGESNTFEWKINHNNDNEYFRSDSFAINGYSHAWLEALRHFYSYSTVDTINLWQFRLFVVDQEFLPPSYTFSICDREGRDYITVKGKIMMKNKKCLLMTLDYDGLSKDDIHRDSLTVRFTGNSELDAREKPSITEDGEDISLFKTLSNDLSALYVNEIDTDSVLKVSDGEFRVHRAVLSARSRVFLAMFHHDTSERRNAEVNIPDVKATVLSDVLYYIYSGKTKGLTVDTAMSMYPVAVKYDLFELSTKCFEFLNRNLTLDNFCEVALLAYTYGEVDLVSRVALFIEEKFNEVVESAAWQKFIKDRALLANKLLTSALKAAIKKKQFSECNLEMMKFFL